jgi:hypothetical protein
MAVLPAATEVARPWLPALLLMLATVATEDVQLAEAVTSLVVPFE